MILFCAFCGKEPKSHEYFGNRVGLVSCCGVSVRTSQGVRADRRWNKIQRALSERSARMLGERLRRKQAKP